MKITLLDTKVYLTDPAQLLLYRLYYVRMSNGRPNL